MLGNVDEFYNNIELRKDFSHDKLPRSKINEMTHCYHRYPAKFIPQLARRILEEFTNEEDYIWDPFCGSGTMNVESFRNERNSLGSDINPIAILISKSKTIPLRPDILSNYKMKIYNQLDGCGIKSTQYYKKMNLFNGNYEKLCKWFSRNNLSQLAEILCSIRNNIPCGKYQNFALCSFSSILKRASFWLSSSIKPQIDPRKDPKDAICCFKEQFDIMEKANNDFYNETKRSNVEVNIILHSAKNKLVKKYKKCYDHIITSPPYIVSYEYYDLFRLSLYFLHCFDNHLEFKSNFIGTNIRKRVENSLPKEISDTIKKIEKKISVSNSSVAKSVSNYYFEMDKFIENANNHLKDHGNLILIVGDTTLRNVYIPNAFLISLIATKRGFHIKSLYKRKIPNKTLPTYRDKSSGKFTNQNNVNAQKIYDEEYILGFEKE